MECVNFAKIEKVKCLFAVDDVITYHFYTPRIFQLCSTHCLCVICVSVSTGKSILIWLICPCVWLCFDCCPSDQNWLWVVSVCVVRVENCECMTNGELSSLDTHSETPQFPSKTIRKFSPLQRRRRRRPTVVCDNIDTTTMTIGHANKWMLYFQLEYVDIHSAATNSKFVSFLLSSTIDTNTQNVNFKVLTLLNVHILTRMTNDTFAY